jgi:adenosylmethionine-8-amino-7-oxononanoate aminotransferase
MHVYHPESLRVLREVADDHGLLLVLDEIATGFGRTGRPFASEWADVTPDVMCVGKALTGGYLSLAAVLMTRDVGEAITRSAFRALLHGPTFMANPLACAVADASVELVESTWKDHVPRITRAALERGVWVRPFRDLVYTMPPYVCTDDDVRLIAEGIVGAVAEAHG